MPQQSDYANTMQALDAAREKALSSSIQSQVLGGTGAPTAKAVTSAAQIARLKSLSSVTQRQLSQVNGQIQAALNDPEQQGESQRILDLTQHAAALHGRLKYLAGVGAEIAGSTDEHFTKLGEDLDAPYANFPASDSDKANAQAEIEQGAYPKPPAVSLSNVPKFP